MDYLVPRSDAQRAAPRGPAPPGTPRWFPRVFRRLRRSRGATLPLVDTRSGPRLPRGNRRLVRAGGERCRFYPAKNRNRIAVELTFYFCGHERVRLAVFDHPGHSDVATISRRLVCAHRDKRWFGGDSHLMLARCRIFFRQCRAASEIHRESDQGERYTLATFHTVFLTMPVFAQSLTSSLRAVWRRPVDCEPGNRRSASVALQ